MRALVLLGSLLLAIPQARAVDGVSFELGASDSSNVSVDMVRVGVQWNWSKRWALGSVTEVIRAPETRSFQYKRSVLPLRRWTSRNSVSSLRRKR